MIKDNKDLKNYLASDNASLKNYEHTWYQHIYRFVNDEIYLINKYLKCLRKQEFYINNDKNSKVNSFFSLLFERKKNRIGNIIGFYIGPNCFGKGLTIYHHGTIIVNPDTRVGENCKLHGNNCIGNNGTDNKCPTIGNNVDIGFGAVIIGDVTIADNIRIGANAVVNKSFTEPGITIAGVPAKKVN